MRNIINKCLSLYVRLRFPKTPHAYRYYIRDTLYCQLVQWRYFFRDYVAKKPYKKIRFEGEFANELQFVIPFAYWHHLNGTLLATESAKGTAPFYFFSQEHLESFDARSNEGNYNFEIPRILYSHNYNMKKWAKVPFKAHYKNDHYRYTKPLLVIANRYNSEWDGAPISYFSKAVLDILIRKLKNNFTIAYNRPLAKQITEDNSVIYDLDEFDWLRFEHPEVLLLHDLYEENKVNASNFNEFQLYFYANCNRFLSIHGGTAALASYFGGINIILSKRGPEHYFRCYERLYPQLSDAQIIHVKTEEQLFIEVDRFLAGQC